MKGIHSTRHKSTYEIDKGDLWNKCGDKGTIVTSPLIPAISSGPRVVDGYVRVGPNRWSRRNDVSDA